MGWPMLPRMKTPTRIAIERAGGARAIAGALGITRQAVEQWATVPAKHVLAVEQLSGVSRYELRPDIYGSPPDPKGRIQSVA